LYDSENLYVIVDVTDDSLQNDSAGSWQDDSVEIYFDGGNTKVNTALSGDDHQYTFGWTTDEIQGTNIDGATEGIEQAQVDTDTGWRIEIKLPWLSIQGAAPQARDLIGIDCYYNDDDDGGDSREGKMLTFSAVEYWNDASGWGTAVLGVIPEPVDPGTDGLVAFYPLDNDANDASGNNNHGTPSGDPQWVVGLIGGALEFDGVDDHVDCGNDPSLDITGPITIAAWVYPTGSGSSNYPRIVDKSNGTGGADPGYKMYLRAADNYIVTLSAGGTFLNSSLAADLNAWNYVAFVTDGTHRKLFLNGAWEEWEESALPSSSSNPLFIGNSPAGARHFQGMIDEVAIYNRGLSRGEVLYLAGFRVPDTLSGLPDITVVDGSIESIRHEGTEYVVADGALALGTTTRWYIPAETGVPTLWAEGDPAPAATVSGTSDPKEGDVGSKADNFLFTLDGSTSISSIDGIDFQETIFPSLSDTFFLFERGGNDVGTWQAILADGSLGAAVEFDKASAGGVYADTGINVSGQDAYGVVFKTDMPVQGVRITASGHDTLSISAVPVP
jgi:hypothetical protein